MTAVYQFEHIIDTRTGGQATVEKNDDGAVTDVYGGRQAYVGLSGSFGMLRLGQGWGAAYNHTGAIRDIANWESGGDTLHSGRFNSVSYSIDTGPVSMQIDAMMGGSKDTGGAVDGASFGMSIPLGDIGKVALGYETKEDTLMPKDVFSDEVMAAEAMMTIVETAGADPMVYELQEITVTVAKNNAHVINEDDEEKETMLDNVYNSTGGIDDGSNINDVITKTGNGKYMIGAADSCVTNNEDAPNYCLNLKAYVYRMKVETSNSSDNNDIETDITETFYVSADQRSSHTFTAAVEHKPPMKTGTKTVVKEYGAKKSHISAQFGLGAVTLGLGYSTKDSNNPAVTGKDKVTYLGASGSIGDTGLSWMAWGRKKEDHDGMETSPWAIGLTKTLGDGARTFIEHGNDDNADGTSRTNIALRVDF